MRGESSSQTSLFSYVDLESRIPAQHPIRKVRKIVDKALHELEDSFEGMYATVGRPSIPPEQLIRALLLQILFMAARMSSEFQKRRSGKFAFALSGIFREIGFSTGC